MEGVSNALHRLMEGFLKIAALNHPRLTLLSVSMFLLKFLSETRGQTLITTKVRLND
jgi:hypothetical protein